MSNSNPSEALHPELFEVGRSRHERASRGAFELRADFVWKEGIPMRAGSSRMPGRGAGVGREAPGALPA